MTVIRKEHSNSRMRTYTLFLVAIIIIGISGLSEAADSTNAGTVSAYAADATSLLLRMPYRGDDNANNTYTVECKPCNDEFFTPWSSAAHTISPYSITISGLSPTACYSIRATYNDPEGVNGTAVQTLKITVSMNVCQSGTGNTLIMAYRLVSAVLSSIRERT